ncbi:hypothetical protein LBMAG48_26160 [Phycisphaerae bacterium]|nr:hypothetical protein LBMAG48_26160 [Phycisphaerae bacterium]
MIVAPAFAQRDIQPVARQLPEFVPGSMWVKLDADRPQAHDSTMRVVRALAGVDQTKTFWLVPGLHLVRVPVGLEREFSLLVRGLEGIEYASVEGVGTTSQAGTCTQPPKTCTDQYCSQQYWVEKINLDDVWHDYAGVALPQVVVAVMDTGLNYNHTDLQANVWNNPGEIPGNGIDDDGNGIKDDIHGAAFVDNPIADPCLPGESYCSSSSACAACDPGSHDPVEGVLDRADYLDGTVNCGVDVSDGPGLHGTAVASVIAATANDKQVRGFTCSMRVMGVRLYHRCYPASGFRESDFVSGLQYAIDEGATVVSSSILLRPDLGNGSAMIDAIGGAYNSDVVYVQSAGNEGQDLDNPADPTKVYVPQQIQFPHVLVVGATDENDALANFPGGGATNVGGGTVSIFAPGRNIRTFDGNAAANSVGFLNGTSFSTPMVAAAVALFRSLNPTATAEDCVNAVVATRRFVPALAPHCRADGILDVHALLNYP